MGIGDFYRAYFLLTTVGKWTLLKFNEKVVVLRAKRELYDIQNTEWMDEQQSVITLSKDCRYHHTGQLSMLDYDILEKCNFIKT